MAEPKARFAPGGARPAPATTIAAPRTELFPGIDRPTIVFWLGLSLLVVTQVADGGPLHSALLAAQGKDVGSTSFGLRETFLELFVLGVLYVMAQASDEAGTLAILVLVALWLLWLLIHLGGVQTVVLGKAPGTDISSGKK